MREQGFEYIAADFKTVRRGMVADQSLPGLSEEEFVEKHGFGIATLYTGKFSQLADGYSPGKIGLGERNVQIFKGLSPTDQVAYNYALLGEHTDVTFAVGLEIENFSRCGGCTLKAIQQVFKPEQLKASYYNPRDAMVKNDPRMKAALREYTAEMAQRRIRILCIRMMSKRISELGFTPLPQAAQVRWRNCRSSNGKLSRNSRTTSDEPPK